MIDFFRRVFLRIHRWWMRDKKYREGEIWILQRYFEEDEKHAANFFNNFRDELLKVAENDIHLLQYHRSHILKSVELINYFKLDRKNLIVDVGGFDGETSKMFALSLSEATILSFEPIKSNYDKILNNVNEIKNIQVYNFGLGSYQKNAIINKTANISSSSLVTVESEIENEFFSEKLKVTDKEEITIKTLDEVVGSNQWVNILKIDVQGYEMEVLLGAEQTLNKTNIILVEMQNHNFYKGAPQYNEIDAFLLSKGFILFDILPALRKEGKLYEWDAIYVKNSLSLS